MSEISKFDQEYADWIKTISMQFKQSQIKAASRVNEEMLIFYWSLGRDIIQQDAQNKYGSGFYKKVSADLRKELPDVKSFSVTNLHYMSWFYELYPDAIKNLPQVGVDSLEVQNLPQVEVKTGCGIFNIPWGHNKLIIDKCKGDPTFPGGTCGTSLYEEDHHFQIRKRRARHSVQQYRGTCRGS